MATTTNTNTTTPQAGGFMEWIKNNSMLAGGIALGLLALMFMGGSKKQRLKTVRLSKASLRAVRGAARSGSMRRR